ncbi:hypothetical protein [Microbacterium sp.]|uniref:hypothetical protein n=1 Tax=Microbacterium sp. TaxID=51671 RepID=UPI00356277DA
MLQESDAAELRALQAKAYGRDGGLTEADAARLRELEGSRAESEAASPMEVAPIEGLADDAPVGESRDVSRPADVSATEILEETEGRGSARQDRSEDDAPLPSRTAAGLRQTLRRHWKPVAAASVALLVIGVAAGWALFGRDDAVALTPEQQERRAELQVEGKYDPGSVRAIGQDDDIIVWFATKDDGEMVCVTIDTAEDSARQCQRAEEFESGAGAGVSITAAADGEDAPQQIWASATRTMNGEIVAFIQRWDNTQEDWLAQFQGEERESAEALVAQGFEEYSFSVIGYFGDAPVWSAQRLVDGAPQDCLVVDAVDALECTEAGQTQAPGHELEVSGVTVDNATGASSSWSVTLAYTPTGTSYLIVSGEAPAAEATVKPGDTFEVGGEKQDPIQVEVPSDDPAG